MADFEARNNSAEREMEDLEGTSLTRGSKSNVIYKDPVSDMLLGYYKGFYLDEAEKTRYIVLASPLSLILVFYIFIS